MRREYCERCNTGVKSLIPIDEKALTSSPGLCFLSTSMCPITCCCSIQHTVLFFIFVPPGLIIGLLSSSALVYALSDILRVPADLLRLLSVPDVDINSCSRCIADSLLIVTEKNVLYCWNIGLSPFTRNLRIKKVRVPADVELHQRRTNNIICWVLQGPSSHMASCYHGGRSVYLFPWWVKSQRESNVEPKNT